MTDAMVIYDPEKASFDKPAYAGGHPSRIARNAESAPTMPRQARSG